MMDESIPNRLASELAEHFRCRSAEEGMASLTLAETHRLAQEFGCAIAEVELAALQARVVPERYRRNLGTVGFEGQMRLLRATVAVVGAGGLGGWIIEGLARMGVGHLILVDGDVFQENNLNRQLGCTESTLGRSKVACMAERVAQVNRAVRVTAHHAWLTEENGATLLAGAEVIVDALDTLPARLLLQRMARAMGVPLVHGAIGGYTGQVMTIFPEDPGLEALYGPQVRVERGVEAQLGNPAATPMMIAAWEIQEVVKHLVGQGMPLRGRMLLLDAEYGEASEIRIESSDTGHVETS